MVTSLPAVDELEISVFGPGYGECVVVHLGAGDWAIVDSCCHPDSGEPVALTYLDSIGVDVASAVKLVCITHWHDDHVRGIGKIVASARAAQVFCSGALNTKEFHAMFTDADVLADEGEDTKVNELSSVFDILKSRRQPGQRPQAIGPRWVHAGMLLYERPGVGGIPHAKVTALSPSAGTTTRMFHELHDEKAMSTIRPVPQEPNDIAIALHVAVGAEVALLGSDLEITGGDPSRGWQAVLDLQPRPSSRAALIKVPHHGSETGAHAGIWTDLALPAPMSVITPFVRGTVALPTDADLERVRTRSGALHMTSPPRPDKAPKFHQAVRKTIGEIGYAIVPWARKHGQVQVRTRGGRVDVSHRGAAFQV